MAEVVRGRKGRKAVCEDVTNALRHTGAEEGKHLMQLPSQRAAAPGGRSRLKTPPPTNFLRSDIKFMPRILKWRDPLTSLKVLEGRGKKGPRSTERRCLLLLNSPRKQLAVQLSSVSVRLYVCVGVEGCKQGRENTT